MNRTARTILLFLAIAGAAASRAPAQSASYLVPDRYELAAGSEVRVHVAGAKSGDLKAIAWPGRDLEWLFVRTAGTQRNLSEIVPGAPGEDFVRLSLPDADVAMIGIDRRPWVEEVPGVDMQRFLELDVVATTLPADWKAQTARKTVRVRHVESAKLLVRAVTSDAGKTEAWLGSATASSKSGQRTEIRPLLDPTAMAVGSDLPLKISWADSSSADATIIARQPVAATRRTSPARGGSGWFTVNAPGEWLVEVHRAKPLSGDPGADWEIETATLGFQVPSAKKSSGGGK